MAAGRGMRDGWIMDVMKEISWDWESKWMIDRKTGHEG
jgi:hypothetical protein